MIVTMIVELMSMFSAYVLTIHFDGRKFSVFFFVKLNHFTQLWKWIM